MFDISWLKEIKPQDCVPDTTLNNFMAVKRTLQNHRNVSNILGCSKQLKGLENPFIDPCNFFIGSKLHDKEERKPM